MKRPPRPGQTGRAWLLAYVVGAAALEIFVWHTIDEITARGSIRPMEVSYQLGAVGPETQNYLRTLRLIVADGTVEAGDQARLGVIKRRLLSHLTVLPPFLDLLPDNQPDRAVARREVTELEALLVTIESRLAAKPPPKPAELLDLAQSFEDGSTYFDGDVIRIVETDMVAQQDRLQLFATGVGALFSVLALSGFGLLYLLMVLRRKNRALHMLATVDDLTSLPNRQTGIQRGESLAALARRTGQPFALAVLDLDHFKKINDSHGHPAGDAALETVARILDLHRGAGGIAARMGGEEFILALPAADAAAAGAQCEALRRALAAASVPFKDKTLTLTASIGVAVGAGAEIDFDLLYSRADAALYRAKAAGRDRVVVADPF